MADDPDDHFAKLADRGASKNKKLKKSKKIKKVGLLKKIRPPIVNRQPHLFNNKYCEKCYKFVTIEKLVKI